MASGGHTSQHTPHHTVQTSSSSASGWLVPAVAARDTAGLRACVRALARVGLGSRLLVSTRKARGVARGVGATIVEVSVAWALLARGEVRDGRRNRQLPFAVARATACLRACVRALARVGLGSRLLVSTREVRGVARDIGAAVVRGSVAWALLARRGRRRELSRTPLRTALPAWRIPAPGNLAARGVVR